MKKYGGKMSDSPESIRQNLIDAGCDKELIERFMAMDAEQQKSEMLAMLVHQRRQLLDCIHADERRIYCLDYLITKLKNT